MSNMFTKMNEAANRKDKKAGKKQEKTDIPKDNNINKDINNNINKDINNNINKERKPRRKPNKTVTKAEVTVSKIEEILSGETEKKKVPQYLHLKPEIVKLLDKYAGKNKKGRGSQKSELVNAILEDFFRKRGDL